MKTRLAIVLVCALLASARLLAVFPTSSVLDDFNRANGALGANWGTLSGLGASALTIDTNTLVAGSGYQGSYWSASTFGPDVDAYMTISETSIAELFAGVLVRISAPTGATDGYGCHYAPENSGEVFIARYDDGSDTELGARVAFTSLTDGDGLGCEAIGSTIKLYTREGGVWTERVSRTDGTYGGAGNIGVHTFDVGGITYRFDDVAGGTISAGSSGPPVGSFNLLGVGR